MNIIDIAHRFPGAYNQRVHVSTWNLAAKTITRSAYFLEALEVSDTLTGWVLRCPVCQPLPTPIFDHDNAIDVLHAHVCR